MKKSNKSKWLNLALVTSSAIGVAGLLYYISKNKENKKSCSHEDTSTSAAISEIEIKSPDANLIKDAADENSATKITTVKQFLDLLDKIQKSQDELKVMLRMVYAENEEKNYNFDTLCARIKELHHEDPLKAACLTLPEFDRLIMKFQTDLEVQKALAKIMGNLDHLVISDTAKTLTVEKIIEIHEYMLEIMLALLEEFKKNPKKDSYDMKIVPIAMQAQTTHEVKKKFGIEYDDLEGAILVNQNKLSVNEKFIKLNAELQSAISEVLGQNIIA